MRMPWGKLGVAGAGLVAYSAAKAGRGETIADASGTAARLALPGFALASGLAMMPVLGALGPVAPVAATLLSLAPAAHVAKFLNRSVRTFGCADRAIRRLEIGGDYRDTDSAAALRMTAIQEMSGAMTASRRFFGREALHMHR